jgi:hypothetical protein
LRVRKWLMAEAKRASEKNAPRLELAAEVEGALTWACGLP